MEVIKIKSLNLDVELVTSFFGKLRGLMFSKKRNLLFAFDKERMVDIHMLFVFYPLIVVWIDEKKRVTKVKKMHPFISFSVGKGKWVLEIPYDGDLLRKLNKAKKLKF